MNIFFIKRMILLNLGISCMNIHVFVVDNKILMYLCICIKYAMKII